MGGQGVLMWALAAAAVAVAAALVVALMRVTAALRVVARRLDETLGELERTAEEIRKTSASVRGVMVHAETAASHVAELTDSARRFSTTLDAASGVLQHVAVPALGTIAGGLAGAKAVASTVVERIRRKKGGPS